MPGKIQNNWKTSLISELIDSITSNSAVYYAFVGNPITRESVPDVGNDDYNGKFFFNWSMLFGKRLANTNFVPVINNVPWTTNTVYNRYDNTSNTLYSNTTSFYAITPPDEVGGFYHVFKCIDNANGAPSTEIPDQIQSLSFTKSDGYKWRYIYSVSSANYRRFATDDYFPVFANTTTQSLANNYNGVEVVMIANGGSGYDTYHSGTIQSTNTTVVQIENTGATENDFYATGSIYIYNIGSSTAQLRNISSYVSNLAGNWVTVDSPVNTSIITPSITKYTISPRVKFNTDGDETPQAYCTINSAANSIHSVVIIDSGYGISRATANIVANTAYGSGANVYCIVPPAGGHGFDPANEFSVAGIGVSFFFANSESNTVLVDTTYNQVGIIRNPSGLTASATKGSLYTNSTFSSILEAFVAPAATFTVGDTVTGQTSNAVGIVVTSNSSYIRLTGDQHFIDSETIVSSNLETTTSLTLVSTADIYTKDLSPLYVQNIDNVTRDDEQAETYKIIIQV